MTGNDVFSNVSGRISKLEVKSGISFIDALNTAIEVVFLKLWARRSDIVKGKLGLSLSTSPFSLPSDFRGFAEDPYLVDYNEEYSIGLSPLPPGQEFEQYKSTEKPRYYQLNGFNLYIFPYTEEQVASDLEMLATLEMSEILEMVNATSSVITHTLHGQYFSCPEVIDMSDTLPWGGIFDGIISDAVVFASEVGGVSSLLANAWFQVTLDQALDGVLNSRNSPSPRRTVARFF